MYLWCVSSWILSQSSKYTDCDSSVVTYVAFWTRIFKSYPLSTHCWKWVQLHCCKIMQTKSQFSKYFLSFLTTSSHSSVNECQWYKQYICGISPLQSNLGVFSFTGRVGAWYAMCGPDGSRSDDITPCGKVRNSWYDFCILVSDWKSLLQFVAPKVAYELKLFDYTICML
jgi:hypothetical protein